VGGQPGQRRGGGEEQQPVAGRQLDVGPGAQHPLVPDDGEQAGLAVGGQVAAGRRLAHTRAGGLEHADGEPPPAGQVHRDPRTQQAQQVQPAGEVGVHDVTLLQQIERDLEMFRVMGR